MDVSLSQRRTSESHGRSNTAAFGRYLTAAFVWYIIYLLLPSDLSGVWYLAGGLTTVAVVGIRMRALEPPVRTVVLLLYVSGICALGAGIGRSVESLAHGEHYRFPSVADLGVVASYCLLIAAAVTMLRHRVTRLTVDSLLDALVGIIAVAVAQWTMVLSPYLVDASPNTGALVLNLTYALGSLVLVAVAILALVAGGRRTVANRMLAAALFATVGIDASTTLVLAGAAPEWIRTAAAPLGMMLGTAGILHPSVVLLTSPPSGLTQLRRLTRKRIALLGLALTAGPTLLVVLIAGGQWSRLMVPATATLVIAPLVVLRLARLVQQNEELAALEASLRTVGERLVSADTAHDVATVIADGAAAVLGPHLRHSALVLLPSQSSEIGLPPEVARRALDALGSRRPDELVTADLLEVPAVLGESTDVGRRESDEHLIVGVVKVQGQMRAALVLEMDRPLRGEELNAVNSLCREGAIALRAVEQTELQVRQRSEERFGALIENSSDIVAVLDHA